jgi:hypothetical protein
MADNEINDACSGFFDFRDNEESSFESQSVVSSSISFLESPINSQQIKKPKLSKNQSFVWKYFKKIENEKAQCIIPIIKNGKEEPCNASYKFTGSTSNMKYHLNVMHNKTEDEEKKVNIIFDKRILFISNIFNFKLNLYYRNKKYNNQQSVQCLVE